MDNVEKLIKSYNKKILYNDPTNTEDPCNCRNKNSCPLDGKCRSKCIVYKATIASKNSTKNYIGISEGDFKLRYNNHKKSFKHEAYKYETELSKYIWKLKNKKIEFQIRWNILAKTMPYSGGGCNCSLFLSEELFIATTNDNDLLNKKTEII